MFSDPLQVVARIAEVLETLQVPYLIGGSLASSSYGIPRATQDVDLVAALAQEHIAPLIAALESEFYIDPLTVHEALQRHSSFNVIHLPTMYKADIFVLQTSAWAQEEMARRRRERIDPNDLTVYYLCSPEDAILHKLEWYRMGGGVSDRQWNDVLGVLKVQAGALDLIYLRHWSLELGLADLLERALGEAGLTP